MKRTSPGTWVGRIYAVTLCIVMVVPIIIMIGSSFSSSRYLTFPPSGFSLEWYELILDRDKWVDSFFTSLQVGAVTAVLSVLVAVPTALALVRLRFRGKEIVYGIVLLPMIVPIVVLALGMYFVLVRLGLAGTVIGMALGHTLLVLPMVVLVLTAVLQGFDTRLEQAAIGLGAPPLRAFAGITLRVIAPAVIASAVFAFLTSFDEVVISLYLIGPNATTLAAVIWQTVILGIDPSVSAAGTIIVVLTLVLAGAAILIRSLGRADSRRSGDRRRPPEHPADSGGDPDRPATAEAEAVVIQEVRAMQGAIE